MRMTRAALRAQASEEVLKQELDVQLKKQGIDVDVAETFIHQDADALDEASPQQEYSRPALRDITDENYPSTVDNGRHAAEDAEQENSMGKKTGRQTDHVGKKQHRSETLASVAQTAESEREQDVPQDVPTDNEIHEPSPESLSTPHDVPTLEKVELESSSPRPTTEKTPDSLDAIYDTPVKYVVPLSKTPKFNPEVHLSTEDLTQKSQDSVEDSFVESIKTRSPSKLARSQDQESKSCNSPLQRTPSQSASKSPASPRIEDSVDQLDALEDAIEKISGDLSTMEPPAFDSPVKQRRSPRKVASPTKISSTIKHATTQANQAAKTPQTARSKPIATSTVKDRVKAIETRPAFIPNRRNTSVDLTRRPIVSTAMAQNQPTTAHKKSASLAAKTDMSFSNSPAKSQPVPAKKRVISGPLSTSKPGFVPAKSSKAPTTSTFALPGDAVAAKLKAQREERLKREEEETAKKQQFKARPIPAKLSRPSVVPRENKASQARMSIMTKSGENKENVAPTRPTTTTQGVTVAKTRTETKPNTSARRTTAAAQAGPAQEKKAAPVSQRITSLSSGEKTTVTKEDAVQLKAKGREVFGRHKATREQIEKEKREKEDAAKKARAVAAERGRQASREWAEKQKKKLLEQTLAKAGDEENGAVVA